VTHFSVGNLHSIVVTDSKDIWCFGNNNVRQLGSFQHFQNSFQIQIPEMNNEKIKQLACNNYYSAILTEDFKLFISGRVYFYQTTNFTWDQFLKEEKVISISCGGDFLLAMNEKNQVFGLGSNDVHQFPGIKEIELAEMTLIPSLCNLEIVKFSTGKHHSVGMTKQGFCYGFGWNKMYNLGLNHRETKQEPTLLTQIPLVKDVSTSENASFFITERDVYYCGIMEEFKMKNALVPTKILPNEKINQVACGNHYFIAFYSKNVEDLHDERFLDFRKKIRKCWKFFDVEVNTCFEKFEDLDFLTLEIGSLEIK
jgi:alpha-tubulin suppressor-like RCC1 family protein